MCKIQMSHNPYSGGLTWDGTNLTCLGPILLTDGSATVPSLAFTSESTLGLYRPSATNLSLATGNNLIVPATLGTEKITWDATGWDEGGVEWTVAGTPVVITHATGNTTALTSTLASAIVAGVTYKVVITYTQVAGTCSYTLGGVTGSSIATSAVSTSITDYITASTTAQMIITPLTTSNIVISSISIKALTDATGDLTVDGNLIVRSQILLPYSNYAYPALASRTTPTTGIYVGSNTVDSVISGAQIFRVLSTGVRVYNDLISMGSGSDLIFTRASAATLQLGANAATATAQTLKAADSSTGGVAGANLTLQGGTPGAGGTYGDVIFQASGGKSTTPGAIEGLTSILTNGATADVTAAQMRGQTHLVTGAYTLDLPTAAVGLCGTFIATTAAAFSLDVETVGDIIILNGVALAAGNRVTTDASINATLYVESTATGYYRVNTIVGIASDGGA